MLWLLYLWEKSFWCSNDRRLNGPQSQSECCGTEKNLLPLPGIEAPAIQLIAPHYTNRLNLPSK
jgi:hypothetical protein